jgi:hypothetical protein
MSENNRPRLRVNAPEFVNFFRQLHGIESENVQEVRAIAKANLDIILHYEETGKLTSERLVEVIENDYTTAIYEMMLKAIDDKDDKKFKSIYDQISIKPDIFCGWLVFYNKFLINKYNLNILPESRADKNYREFINGNKMTQFPEG